jgi:hypothetical protein
MAIGTERLQVFCVVSPTQRLRHDVIQMQLIRMGGQEAASLTDFLLFALKA